VDYAVYMVKMRDYGRGIWENKMWTNTTQSKVQMGVSHLSWVAPPIDQHISNWQTNLAPKNIEIKCMDEDERVYI